MLIHRAMVATTSPTDMPSATIARSTAPGGGTVPEGRISVSRSSRCSRSASVTRRASTADFPDPGSAVTTRARPSGFSIQSTRSRRTRWRPVKNCPPSSCSVPRALGSQCSAYWLSKRRRQPISSRSAGHAFASTLMGIMNAVPCFRSRSIATTIPSASPAVWSQTGVPLKPSLMAPSLAPTRKPLTRSSCSHSRLGPAHPLTLPIEITGSLS